MNFVSSLFTSEVDEYGFKRDRSLEQGIYEDITTNYYKTLIKRRKKWEDAGKNFHSTKSQKLKRYIRKGIPGMVQIILRSCL